MSNTQVSVITDQSGTVGDLSRVYEIRRLSLDHAVRRFGSGEFSATELVQEAAVYAQWLEGWNCRPPGRELTSQETPATAGGFFMSGVDSSVPTM